MAKTYTALSSFISPLYKDAIFPQAHENFYFMGASVIDQQTQLTNKNFGGEDVMTKIQSFLDELPDKKPVYMGWGSMVCKSPEYMAKIAVQALHRLGERGIILGGYAELSMEHLKNAKMNAKERETLVEYAEKNILFVPKAPHEKILPLVSCVVHHGGAGTTNASLRSGVPTIITPCFWDQYDYSHLVKVKGLGVGFSKQFQSLSVKELADAIHKCITDVDIQRRAREFGKLMRDDASGSDTTVKYIQNYWKETALTGIFHRDVEIVRQEGIAENKKTEKQFQQARRFIYGTCAAGACYAMYLGILANKKGY